ncbi:MAG: hypothetical protein FJZ90_03055 [Chloroflexi bacterium]|nr:hypothetical protein [Chloroflexota bacterium]
MDIEQLGAAIAAAFVVYKLVEAVIEPIWTRYLLDRFWLLYIALAIGAPLGWYTGINALPVFGVSPVVGRILTCLVIGLGPSFIHDLTDGN